MFRYRWVHKEASTAAVRSYDEAVCAQLSFLCNTVQEARCVWSFDLLVTISWTKAGKETWHFTFILCGFLAGLYIFLCVTCTKCTKRTQRKLSGDVTSDSSLNLVPGIWINICITDLILVCIFHISSSSCMVIKPIIFDYLRDNLMHGDF